MEHTSSENMSEALKLLEEAARQKKDELKAALSDKYANLRSLIMETEGGIGKSLACAKHDMLQAVAQAKDASVEKACEITRNLDKSVHQSPWPYIAGAAAIGALLGFSMGRSRK